MLGFYRKETASRTTRLFFHHPTLSSIVDFGDEDAQSALQVFIHLSKSRCGEGKRLFIPISQTSTIEDSHNILSLWLGAIILQAYEIANNPHEICVVALMMALHSNCSSRAIMEGCFLRSDSVFASHFLKDVTLEDVEGIQSFGPLL